MKPTTSTKKPQKDQRENLILLGLVELYLQFGKPVGSNTQSVRMGLSMKKKKDNSPLY
ncbi:MAG: hypothetical protein NTZ52_06075 [Chlamydiae bacterium]|nr:hypothetical protein [Chlamydiota bacterium]